MQRISPCLWFDNQAEEAVNFYLSIFKNAKIKSVTRFGEAGPGPKGSVMVIAFELDGVELIALNGGPIFKFNEAVSLQVYCTTQKEIDYYWDRLREGGDPNAQQCGWLKDRFGLSWQVVPPGMEKMLKDHKSAKAQRAMAAVMQMKKFDIAALERAAKG